MSYTRTTLRLIAPALLAAVMPVTFARADNLTVSSIAPGYTYRSIELGVPFGGSIAQDTLRPAILYVSYGNFGVQRVLELDKDTGTTRTITPVIGNIGGLAVLNNGDLAITENFDMAVDTILKAHDGNLDGDFLDTGEITELISPILTEAGDFTGAQMVVAPASNASQIPAGSLVVQTADGGTSSELLVVQNPATAPEYRPAGQAYFSGFNYNGGVAFTGTGDIIMGTSEFPTGRILALVNSNGNDRIDAGESHEIVGSATLTNSIADLSVSADGKLLTTENSGTVRMFTLPANLLTGTATNGTLVETNGTYLSSVRLDVPSRRFGVETAGDQAVAYVGGYVAFPAATNLLAIRAIPPSAAEDWQLFQ